MTRIFVNWSLRESGKEDFRCLILTYIPTEEQSLNQYLNFKIIERRGYHNQE